MRFFLESPLFINTMPQVLVRSLCHEGSKGSGLVAAQLAQELSQKKGWAGFASPTRGMGAQAEWGQWGVRVFEGSEKILLGLSSAGTGFAGEEWSSVHRAHCCFCSCNLR